MNNFKNAVWYEAYHKGKYGRNGAVIYHGLITLVRSLYWRKYYDELAYVENLYQCSYPVNINTDDPFNEEHQHILVVLPPIYTPLYFPELFFDKLKTFLMCLKKYKIKLTKYLIFEYFGNICDFGDCAQITKKGSDCIKISKNNKIVHLFPKKNINI